MRLKPFNITLVWWYVSKPTLIYPVQRSPVWISGLSRSGKTKLLAEVFCQWVKQHPSSLSPTQAGATSPSSTALILAANSDNRVQLSDRLTLAIEGNYPIQVKTPLGFVTDEVMLFWPLLLEDLSLTAHFPLRLRPETEQVLATKLWQSYLTPIELQKAGVNEYRFVRQTLDLLQLAGASGIPAGDISTLLTQGIADDPSLSLDRGALVLEWRKWCLERGLLSYGLILELFGQNLLPHPQYQKHLLSRYDSIFADDVDDYPAIIKDLADFFLDNRLFGGFTYNPDGQVRLGLQADPQYWLSLSSRCQIQQLSNKSGLAMGCSTIVTDALLELQGITPLPTSIQSLQTTSRAQLLRRTANFIINAIDDGAVKAEDIAIIAPGLDAIARYTFLNILTAANIPTQPLNEQRSLISSPLIRGLLTLLGLACPGLGRLIQREDVAEMLVILSDSPNQTMKIDPVRAGILADYCYRVDVENPVLLPIEAFNRWDRFGHSAATSYQKIVDWLTTIKSQQRSQTLGNPVEFLDQAIRYFFTNERELAYEQLAVLRELLETAQHYWEVNQRICQQENRSESVKESIAEFIQFLRRGTISANPYPFQPFGNQPKAITLATIYQYRCYRTSHRWHFWLDVGSDLWQKDYSSNLFAAPLFLRNWSGYPISAEASLKSDSERLERVVRDLLGRVDEQLYLCHSDLSVSGAEQNGPLLSLVNASQIVSNQ